MKIALVSPYDWQTPGGVNGHIDQLATQLLAHGHQVRILAPCSGPATDHRVIGMGHPVSVPVSGSQARIALDPLLGRRVRRLLEREQFDVVHVHEPLMPTLPIQVLRHARRANPRCITVGTFHARKDGGNRWYEYGRPLLQRWFRALDGKIAVSPPAAQYVGRYFHGYYNIIPNGIDPERWSSPAVEPIPELQDGRINVLYVGRAEKRKGLPHLIRAFRMLHARIPSTRLVIVGPESRRLRRYRTSMAGEWEQSIVFAGGISNADLPRYHRSAHIFCSPATGHESQGYVLLEAMSAGLPVVASNIEGYASVVTHGVDGLLVPPRDPLALADVLTALVRDPQERARLGMAGRIRAEDYSWPRVTQQLLSYYERLRGEQTLCRDAADEQYARHEPHPERREREGQSASWLG